MIRLRNDRREGRRRGIWESIDVPQYNTTFLKFPQINLLFVRIELNLLFVRIDQIILVFEMTEEEEEEEEEREKKENPGEPWTNQRRCTVKLLLCFFLIIYITIRSGRL